MRSNGFQITGNELKAMSNEGLIGVKTSIEQTNRCLTRQEVFNSVYCYAGDAPSGNFIPFSSWEIGGVQYTGPSPNLTCNFEYINPILANSVTFWLNQEGNPYLNADLFANINGNPLRLDPANNLDGMFFGGPQISPEMRTSTPVGGVVYVQANFGLNSADGASWGWDAPGIGKLEVYANGTLVSNQTLWKYPYSGPNSQSLSYSFTVQAGVTYYVKAYSLVAYAFDYCYHVNNAYYACGGDGDCGCIQC
jgi:hypothetical protein